MMTKLVQKAFKEAAKLPDVAQDQLAAQLLQDLADEARRDEAFAASADVLERLAAGARAELRAGRTRRQMALLRFEQARQSLLPLAEAQGILTDEDIFDEQERVFKGPGKPFSPPGKPISPRRFRAHCRRKGLSPERFRSYWHEKGFRGSDLDVVGSERAFRGPESSFRGSSPAGPPGRPAEVATLCSSRPG